MLRFQKAGGDIEKNKQHYASNVKAHIHATSAALQCIREGAQILSGATESGNCFVLDAIGADDSDIQALPGVTTRTIQEEAGREPQIHNFEYKNNTTIKTIKHVF